MYPYDIIPGFDIYALMYLCALVSAILILRILSDKLKVETKLYNFVLANGVFAIVCGYVCSVLTQSVYDWIETGKFKFGTGMTFYGGLIGGIFAFLLVYFTLGRKLFGEGKLYLRRVPTFENIAACCVTFAHATGRIGCLFAGCCYGRRTDAWYGIWNEHLGYKTVPTQLFESVFLYLMFALVVRLTLRGKYGCHIIYMIGYGVWRFAIEYLRADDRGASFIPGLTPSQVSAIVFVAAGIILYIIERNVQKRAAETEVRDCAGTENESDAD